MNDQLLQRVRNCPNLPSLPAIAVQVLELTSQRDVDITQIAKLIAKDPAMSGKILKTVNSSFYGRSKHVSTISQALVILGLQSVKTLVLGFSLVSNLTRTKSRGFDHLTYWKRSIYAATAARSCAAKAGLAQQEEAFLGALLMDIGMLVMDLCLGEQYGEVNAAVSTHEDLSAAERAAVGGTHADVGGMIALQWKLPPLLASPIANHHGSSGIADPAIRRVAEVVHLGGRIADVFVDADPSRAIADVRRLLGESCGMTEADADALLQEIGTRTKEVASLFEISIGASGDYEAILRRANETLVELTLDSQLHATHLEEQNVQLKRAATTDGLTGLSNRAHFDAFLAEQFKAAVAGKTYLSLLLMDVDKFKLINDEHGHPSGDAVLRALGQLLRSAARPQDLAARYGGEEMCLVLAGTPKVVAATIGESVRRAIAAKPINVGALELPVTASIGVASFEPGGAFREVAHLLKAADLAVYAAKKAGRNCVRVFTLPGAAQAAA